MFLCGHQKKEKVENQKSFSNKTGDKQQRNHVSVFAHVFASLHVF